MWEYMKGSYRVHQDFVYAYCKEAACAGPQRRAEPGPRKSIDRHFKGPRRGRDLNMSEEELHLLSRAVKRQAWRDYSSNQLRNSRLFFLVTACHPPSFSSLGAVRSLMLGSSWSPHPSNTGRFTVRYCVMEKTVRRERGRHWRWDKGSECWRLKSCGDHSWLQQNTHLRLPTRSDVLRCAIDILNCRRFQQQGKGFRDDMSSDAMSALFPWMNQNTDLDFVKDEQLTDLSCKDTEVSAVRQDLFQIVYSHLAQAFYLGIPCPSFCG